MSKNENKSCNLCKFRIICVLYKHVIEKIDYYNFDFTFFNISNKESIKDIIAQNCNFFEEII